MGFSTCRQQYQLLWESRLGFARLAVEHGYPIVPFARVGAEEMYEIVADDNTQLLGQLKGAVEKLTKMPMPPMTRGLAGTPIPNPQRLYFWFGEPLQTKSLQGHHENERVVRAVRNKTKQRVEEGIAFLLAEREADPDRGLATRLLGRAAT